MPSLSHHAVNIILNSLVSPGGSEVCVHARTSKICVHVLTITCSNYRALYPLLLLNLLTQTQDYTSSRQTKNIQICFLHLSFSLIFWGNNTGSFPGNMCMCLSPFPEPVDQLQPKLTEVSKHKIHLAWNKSSGECERLSAIYKSKTALWTQLRSDPR